MTKLCIATPAILHLIHDNEIYYAGNQEWYLEKWQRNAGCGPTNCSLLLWYLAKTRKECYQLLDQHDLTKDSFLSLMEQVWHFVTPGKMGVHLPETLTNGGIAFAQQKNIALEATILTLAKSPFCKQDLANVETFLVEQLSNDLPVTFLNLSNGSLKNLDNWHWVSIISYDLESHVATIYDQSIIKDIDIKLWLETSLLKGSFASLKPKEKL